MKHSFSSSALLSSISLVSFTFAQDDLLEEGDALVVTGSRISEPLKDTPVRTEIIDSEVLQNRGVRSLAEAVENSSGVRVETNCQSCNQQSIQMLGLSQQYIGILNNGLPNFSSLAGVYGIEQIPSGMIGQLEVVKGGGSVLYGPGAVAGVINIIPREPDTIGGSVNVKVSRTKGESPDSGMNRSAFGFYDFINEDESLKTSFFFGSDFVAPVDVNEDDFTDISRRDLLSGGCRTIWTPNTDNKLTLDLFSSQEERRGGELSTIDDPANTTSIAEEITSKTFSLTGTWETSWTPEWESKLSYSYAYTGRDSYYGGTSAFGSTNGSTGNLGYGTSTDHLNVLDFISTYSPDDVNRFTFGAQFNHEHVNDEQAAVNRDLEASFSNFGILGQHRYNPSDLWTFEYGARLDLHSELDESVFSPRAALLYTPSDDLRLRTSLSTGFRAPQVFNEDLHLSNVGGELSVITNDANLREENAITLSVSPEWQITDSIRLELNAFHTWLDDTFVIESNDDPNTSNIQEYLRTNGESSRIFGAELNLAYVGDNWDLEFSWVQQKLEYDNPQLIIGDPSLANPNDNAIFSNSYVRAPESLGLLKYSYQGEWANFFITGKLTGPMDVPHVISDANGDLVRNELTKTDWFFNVDAGLSKEFLFDSGLLTATLGVQNLFNEFQRDLDSGAFRDSNYIYGPAFPRTIYTGLKYDF